MHILRNFKKLEEFSSYFVSSKSGTLFLVPYLRKIIVQSNIRRVELRFKLKQRSSAWNVRTKIDSKYVYLAYLAHYTSEFYAS
jgi:hypothetical protein